MSDCISNSNLPSRLLRGVTRTVKITVVDKNENPVDLTIAREVTVRVSMDGRPWSEAYVPGISISGEGNNIVTFTWYADVQRCGRYTIDVNADFGNRNQSRVDFHREFGVELVEHSCDVTVVPEDAMEIDDEVDLEGTLEVTTDGMSAFDQWRTSPESEGYPPTEEGFFAWIRQPATDAATAAATQMGQIQDRADEDHRIAAADHITAGQDHTQAGSDHTRAGEDHTQAASDHGIAVADHGTAGDDHTLAAGDHTTAASDHGIAQGDHTTAASDHGIAANDHTTAAADHTQAGNDHTRAESDHTRAEQDHTRAEQDHASVGEAVKYTAQTLTDAQKTQARTNIGAGTYSLPANGIPKTDLAQAVSTSLNRADAAIIYTDLGEPDWEEYDYEISAFLTTLRTTGYYSFTMDEYVYYVVVQAVDMGTYTYVLQQYWSSEEGPGNVYYRGFVYDNEGDEIVSDNDASYITLQQAASTFAAKTHYHHTSVRDTASIWSYCDTMSSLDATSKVVYTDQTTSTQWLIEGAYTTYQPAVRYQKVTPLQGGTCFYQRCGTASGSTVTWGPWYRIDAVMPIATTQPQGGFLPNIVYDLGTLTGTVTFALASPTDNLTPNVYHWTFDTGSTAPTITWPSGLTWPTDFEPEVNANCHYEVLVRNDYATLLEFSLE